MEPQPFSRGYGGYSRFSAQVLPFAHAISGFDVRSVIQLVISALQCLLSIPESCERYPFNEYSTRPLAT